MGDLIVHDVTTSDLSWSMRTSSPQFRLRVGTYGHPVDVDPFPAYPHDRKALTDAAAVVLAAVRGGMTDLRWDVHLFSADREETSRSNAHSSYARNYGAGEEPDQLDGVIFLSGKRIPPHLAGDPPPRRARARAQRRVDAARRPR